MLYQMFLFNGAPNNPNDLSTLLDTYDKVAEAVLKGSEKLKGLDIENAADSDKVHEILATDKDSIEWAGVSRRRVRLHRERRTQEERHRQVLFCLL